MNDRPWGSTPTGTAGAPLPPGIAADPERAPPGALLLEVAWEVCNQVGGIYQVLRSKAPTMVRRWRNRYGLVGPYVPVKAAVDFEQRRPSGWTAQVIDSLAAEGLRVHHGRWLVSSRPKVLLLECGLDQHRLDEAKYLLWHDHGIESPPDGTDPLFDAVVGFGFAVRRLMAAVCRCWRHSDEADDPDLAAPPPYHAAHAGDRRVLAHFHEWLGGLAIPLIRRDNLPVATVFTTHATLLGRYMASASESFYDHLPFLDHAAEATRFNVRSQHGVERACAHGCDVLTTVSPITGEECEFLLGRRPDMVLPNGLNIDRYNVGHDFQTFHAQFKERIHRFVMGQFFPSYSFDLDKTLYVFTSGRFEPRNKGFDLALEAMARLNAMLKDADLGVTVVFFIITQRHTRSLHPLALQSAGVLDELREVCARITADVGDGLFRRAAAGEKVRLDDLVDEYWSLRFRRTQVALRTDRLPLLTTHLIDDEWSDPVLGQVRALWFSNRAEDPVKIVYHPDFISPVNPLWGLEYEQFVRGCHLGVFPSAYEPWGYTPLECVAMGVPSITSDLAGFGRYVAENYPEQDRSGLLVLRRRGRSYNDAAAELAGHLLDFCKLDRRGRIALRNDVERRSWDFDWSRLARAYDWAHDLAMARAAAR